MSFRRPSVLNRSSTQETELPTQENQIRGYRAMTRGRYQAARVTRRVFGRNSYNTTIESAVEPERQLELSRERQANLVLTEVLYSNNRSTARLHALHQRSAGMNALVVLRDTRWEDSRQIIKTIEVDLSVGTQLVYMFPDMVLSIDDFHNHVEVAIQTYGYDTWKGEEIAATGWGDEFSDDETTPGRVKILNESEERSDWDDDERSGGKILVIYQPSPNAIMGPTVYPPARQNPQLAYKPDYQFGYPQGKGNTFYEGYGEYHNSQWTLPLAWTKSGVMLVLPADPGIWSDVISRWESITINRLNNQTWSDNKAKLAFVENILRESEKLMRQKSRTYKGKPHNSHVKPFKRKYKDDRGRVKKCKCFICGKEGHFAKDCRSKQGNITRSAVYQELDLDDNWDIVSADFDDSSVYSISDREDTPFEEAAFMKIEEINESDDEQNIEEDYDSHHVFMFHPGPPTKIADMVQFVGSWNPNKELPTQSKSCEHDWKENTITNYTICYYCGILTTDMDQAKKYYEGKIAMQEKEELWQTKRSLLEKRDKEIEVQFSREEFPPLGNSQIARPFMEVEAHYSGNTTTAPKIRKITNQLYNVKVKFEIFSCPIFGTTSIIYTGASACCINKKVIPEEALDPLTQIVFFNGLNSRQQATYRIKQGSFLIEGNKFKIPLIYSFDMKDINEIAELEVSEEEFLEINESIYFNQEGSKTFLEQFKPIIDRPLKHMTLTMEDSFKKDVDSLLEIGAIRPSKSMHRIMAMIVNSGTTIDLATRREIKGKKDVYIDDILVFLKNEKEHAKHLEKMLKICEDNGLVLSPTKMKIAVSIIDLLGAVIGEETIKLQPHIIKKIFNFNEEELKTKKRLWSFLGILNYARNHIPKLGILLRPLYEKTNAHGDKRLKSFDYELVRKIKEQVQNLPDLEIPPKNAYIILETDRCIEGWGGIVKWKKSKEDPRGSVKIYAYASGKFSTTQSTIDAETYACINTLEKLKIYYLDKQESKPCEVYKQSYNAKPKYVSECQPKTITGLTKEKTLEYKTKKPEESLLNWKPLPNDWVVTTSKPKEVQTNNPEDNMYRYNRKEFLKDDDKSDDSFFIVDPRWDDYCLQELKMNRPVLLRPDARRARV
nr:ORFIII-like polyprotein [Tanacetum cinerariifolium]